MAAAPPAPAALPVPAQINCRYSDYFADPANDPFKGSYANLLAPYHIDVGQAGIPTRDQVDDFVLAAQTQKIVLPFALMLPDGLIHCYHSVGKFPARPGLPATPWDNQRFATKGELYRNQAAICKWSLAYHDLLPQTRVADPATIDTALAGDPTINHLGPYANTDADTSIVITRRAMVVPPSYAPLLLAKPLTPIEAWTTVRGAMVANMHENSCAAFIRWLQVAITHDNTGASRLPVAVAPTSPTLDPTLIDHRQSITSIAFPHLDGTAHLVQQHQIATQLGALVTETRSARLAQDARRVDDATKHPSDLLGPSGILTLLRFAQLAIEDQLPQVWHTLANTKKSQQINVLQWALDELKEDRGLTDFSFVVSPTLLTKVLSLKFRMQHQDDLASGIQPFVLGDENLDGAALLNNMWSTVNEGSANPSIQDLQTLLQAKTSVPKILLHTRESVKRLELLLAVLFGPTHCMVTGLQDFGQVFINKEHLLTNYIPKNPEYRFLLPVLLSKWLAQQVNFWFKRQYVSPAAVPAPDFRSLFDEIELDRPWEPTLRRALLDQLIGPQQLPSFGTPARQPLPPATPPVVPPATPSQDPALPENRRINNTNFNATLFQRFRDMPVSVRMVRQNASDPLPTSKYETDKSMCLAWHAKGVCNSACRCRYDHQPYTDDEYGPLVSWCTNNYRST